MFDNIKNLKQLQSEKQYLNLKIKEQETLINNHVSELYKSIKPAIKVVRVFFPKKKNAGNHGLVDSFFQGVRSISSYFVTSILTGKKPSLWGITSAAASDSIIKYVKKIDLKKLSKHAMDLLSSSSKKNKTHVDWEHEIYS